MYMQRHTTFSERKFIEKYSEEGISPDQTARELGISIWTVRKWRQRLKKGVRVNRLWAVHLRVP